MCKTVCEGLLNNVGAQWRRSVTLHLGCLLVSFSVCMFVFILTVLEQDSTEIDFCVCMCLCVRKICGSWRSKTVDHTHYWPGWKKKKVSWKGASTDTCQRGWMALIEKTPGFTPEGQKHTVTPLDSSDCSKKAFTVNEWWSLCARMCVTKAVRMSVSLPNICLMLDYLWDFDFDGIIFLFPNWSWVILRAFR